MAKTSVFHELASKLPENERKELLNRIYRSISFGEEKEESIFRAPVQKDEKELLIKREIEKASLIDRIRLWFLSLFRGKSKIEIFSEMKMKDLKQIIQQKYPGLTTNDSKELGAKFAKEVYDIYTLALPLIPLFSLLWKDNVFLENALSYLLDQKIPESKEELFKFFPQVDLERFFNQNESEEIIKKELQRRLTEYFSAIPDRIFQDIEEGVLPLYYMKNLILFPFRAFLSLFKVEIDIQKLTDNPPFKNATAYITLEHLEKLYYGIYTALKARIPVSVHEEFLSYYVSYEEKNQEENHVPPNLDVLKKALKNLSQKIKTFSEQIPLVELIRFYRKDPYYRLYVYMPHLNLKEFYSSTMRLKILNQLDEHLLDIRKGLIDKKTKQVFRGKALTDFSFYREYSNAEFRRLGLPTFSYSKSLNLIYNFIHWYYRTSIQDFIQVIAKGILSQNRIVQNRLLSHAAGIEDLEDKILQLDQSLSPESEDGKAFARVRFNIGKEQSHQRMYRALVIQKDRDARSLIERGKEYIGGIYKIMFDILKSPSDTVKAHMKTIYAVYGKNQEFGAMLQERVVVLDAFMSLLSQVIEFEREHV